MDGRILKNVAEDCSNHATRNDTRAREDEANMDQGSAEGHDCRPISPRLVRLLVLQGFRPCNTRLTLQWQAGITEIREVSVGWRITCLA